MIYVYLRVCVSLLSVALKYYLKKIPFGNLLYKNYIFLFEGEKGADPIIHISVE